MNAREPWGTRELPVNLLRFFLLWPIIQAVLFGLLLWAPLAMSGAGPLDRLRFYYFWIPTTLFRNERLFPTQDGIPVSSEGFALVLAFYAIVAFALRVLIAGAFSLEARRGNLPPS